MGTVTQINSESLLASYYAYPYQNNSGLEWEPFYAGVVLTLVLLPLLYCFGLDDYQLFALLMTKTALGAAIGVAWFELSPNEDQSPVPKNRHQNPSVANKVNFEKAA